MPVPTVAPINPNDIPHYITAVGALGVAAFGAVDSLGKSLLVFKWPGLKIQGLPYAGFGKVRDLIAVVGPALAVTYGPGYEELIKQQYRVDRGAGQAPDTIRQGVRLGLTYLGPDAAAGVIKAVWGMPEANAQQLAQALTASTAAASAAPATPAAAAPGTSDATATTADAQPDGGSPPPAPPAPPATPPSTTSDAQALAARFATALDTRVQAAFELADDIYTSRAQFWAGFMAVGLSLGYQYLTNPTREPLPWLVALLVGLVAVPLAPVAKDLSSSVSDALSALSSLKGPAK